MQGSLISETFGASKSKETPEGDEKFSINNEKNLVSCKEKGTRKADYSSSSKQYPEMPATQHSSTFAAINSHVGGIADQQPFPLVNVDDTLSVVSIDSLQNVCQYHYLFIQLSARSACALSPRPSSLRRDSYQYPSHQIDSSLINRMYGWDWHLHASHPRTCSTHESESAIFR